MRHFRATETEKKMKEKTKIITLSISGILFTYILFKSYHYENIFEIFFYVILGGIGLYTFYNGIFNDIEKYKKTKELKSFSLTIIGIILIVLNLAIFIFYEIKLSSRSLLEAENHGVYFHFNNRNEYIIRSGGYGDSKRFYGKYSINDSIITLDKKYFDDVLVTNRYVIRNIINAKGYDESGKNKNYLIEINQKGLEIKNAFQYEFNPQRKIYYSYKFEITKDNRK